MAKKKGIAAKFILIVSGVTQVLIVALAVVVLYTAYTAQGKQADSFVGTLKSEQQQGAKVMKEGLLRKGESLNALMAKTGAGFIVGYDFDTLQQLAASAVNDPDVVSVVFYGKDGSNVLAEVRDEGLKAAEHLKQEVQFEDETIGFVETGLSFASVDKNVNALSKRIQNLVQVAHAEMDAAGWRLGIIIVLAAGLIVIVMCGAIYWCLSRFVIKPVMVVVDGLDDSATQVTSASGQLSSASHQLAEGAAEEAASLEETSASLEEVSTMTRRNADNASECNSLMKEVNGVVEKANQSMAAQTAAMDEISKASEETSKIIKTIDEIAFQTNLLALNAAVEAARAGEAGAGFAVVADEVRNLAMRAAEAASDTATLIEGTVKKVKEGEELLEQTNEDFSEVSSMASKVGGLVSEIAVASNEQTQGLDQVNTAMGEIDRVTQQTAASSEEAASASEELSSQAEFLKQYVGDLVTLVSGSVAAEKKGFAAGKAGLKRPPSQQGLAAPPPQKETSPPPAPAEAKQALSGPAPVAKKDKPEDIIPMDDDEFEDF